MGTCKVGDLEAKAAAALAAAASAEGVAGAAMSAAEGAVREEMEAAAVVKQTAAALNAVLAELKDLGISFETSAKLERSLEAKGVSKARALAACLCHADVGRRALLGMQHDRPLRPVQCNTHAPCPRAAVADLAACSTGGPGGQGGPGAGYCRAARQFRP